MNKINVEGYAFSFQIGGDLQYQDIVQAFENSGDPTEIVIHTLPGSTIRNGRYTIYLKLTDEQNAETIPEMIEIGGQKVGLRHKMAVVCAQCKKRGHNKFRCKQIKAIEELQVIQQNRKQGPFELSYILN